MSKKTKKGSESLGKTNKIVSIIAGIVTILLALYTFYIIAEMRNMIP